jgi:hypothetical protein
MARRNPPRKVTYFEPVPPRLPRNTVIESTFEVGSRFRCTMRVDCGQLDPGAVIRPIPGGACRGPQCGLSARRTDDRRAPRGRRRVRGARRSAFQPYLLLAAR